LLIEEPEAFLHPEAVDKLYMLMAEVSRREAKQIVFTTHSPLLMERAGGKRLSICVRSREGSSRIVELTDYGERAFKDRGLLRSLMITPFAPGLSASSLLIVEGDDDEAVWKVLVRRSGFAPGSVVVVGDDGVNEATKLSVYLSDMEKAGVRGDPFLLVLDSDGRGDERLREAMTRGLREDQVFVLAKDEIEDYLIDARAIAQAFDITEELAASVISSSGGGKAGFERVIREVTTHTRIDHKIKARVAEFVEISGDLATVIDRLREFVQVEESTTDVR
jgi:hypothetical protein